jgi:hypothetical protein
MNTRQSEATPPPGEYADLPDGEDYRMSGAEFSEFFEDSGNSETHATNEIYDLPFGSESYNDSDEYDGGFIEAMPEELEGSSDWAELYDAGVDYIDAARLVFPEFAEADDEFVAETLVAWTENMSEEELESFWKDIGNLGKKALKFAAPIIQTAAPIVGTAVGAAFGGVGAPIGGVIGNLVGSGVGALNQAVNTPRQARSGQRPVTGTPRTSPIRRRRPRRRVRHQMSRPRFHRPARGRPVRRRVRRSYRRSNQNAAIRRGAARFGRAAGTQLVRVMRDPGVQRAINSGVSGFARGFVGRGEAMSNAAVLAGIHGGILETLRELEAAGIDLDRSDEGYSPVDFESPEEAFAQLIALVEGQEH